MADAFTSIILSTISDLQPAAGAHAGALDDARRAVAVAALTGQQAALLRATSVATAPAASAVAARAAADQIAQLRAAAHPPSAWCGATSPPFAAELIGGSRRRRRSCRGR